MQGGIHAARTIKHRVEAGDPNLPAKPFHYRNLGDMATISRFQAVARIGPIKVAGFLGWLLWLFVHLTFLTGFKNRVATVFNWFIAFIGRGRPQRTITAPAGAGAIGAPTASSASSARVHSPWHRVRRLFVWPLAWTPHIGTWHD